jgi:hypothetical protein
MAKRKTNKIIRYALWGAVFGFFLWSIIFITSSYITEGVKNNSFLEWWKGDRNKTVNNNGWWVFFGKLESNDAGENKKLAESFGNVFLKIFFFQHIPWMDYMGNHIFTKMSAKAVETWMKFSAFFIFFIFPLTILVRFTLWPFVIKRFFFN